jgi:hypothetical protein
MDSSPGAKLIERLQRTLGIAILVQSIEPAEVATDGADASGEGDDVRGADPLGSAVTIRATFLFGSNTTDVAVSGDTETNAWDALARAAIAWRNADYQHIPMWGGGG